MNDPVKCTDCSTWWRGEEHKCVAKPIEKPKYEQLEFEYEYEPKTLEETFKSKLTTPHPHKAIEPLKGEYVTVTCYSCNFHGRLIVAHGCFDRRQKRIEQIKQNKKYSQFSYELNKDKNNGNIEPPKWNA